MKLHNENPELDKAKRITAESIEILGKTDYFENGLSPACVAIMPFVRHWMTGVEIGVFRGASSTIFLDACAFMYFIDPCENYAENPDRDWHCPGQPFLDLLEPYKPRFEFILGYSAFVSEQVPMVDYVFVDANHEHDYVKQDLELYWPKVKPGGFMCGHDYSGGHPGVTKAVDEFFAKLGLPVEQHKYCWLVWKPLRTAN